MTSKPELPKLFDQRPKITVVGVGGAGGNAINNMIASGLDGVDFVAANTDAQALAISSADQRLQLGVKTTEGLGAGADPDLGRRAAEEVAEDVRKQISGSHMVFVAAGMGGGTGTGAAPVIARLARECGALTVAIVSKPFHFEGSRRMRVAEEGIEELRHAVDTLIVIPNQNLFKIANERTTFAEAFVLADQVLYSGIACIVDLIMKDGLINLDFADVRAVMADMGGAVMGTGEAEGDQRAVLAAEEAINNPLLDDVSLAEAEGVLISIIGGPDMTLYEVDEAASRIRQEVDQNANIIVGATFEGAFANKLRVSLIAAGMDRARFIKARENAEGQPSAEAHAATDAASKAHGPSTQAPPTHGPLSHGPSSHGPSAHGGGGASGAAGGDVIPPPLPISQLPRDGAGAAWGQPPAATAPAPHPATPPAPPQPAHTGGGAPGTDRAADFSRALSGDDRAPAGRAASAHGHSHGQTPGHAHDAQRSHGSGQAQGHWQSPEGVRIEPETSASWRDEGVAPPVNEAPAQPHVTDASAQGPAHAPVFEPAMPHEVRGETPRFPTVKEFPPVAQREYEAKANRPDVSQVAGQVEGQVTAHGAAQAQAPAAQAPTVPQNKNVSNAPRTGSPGLISRLTGRLGRSESDAEHDGQDERNVTGTDPNARRAKR